MIIHYLGTGLTYTICGDRQEPSFASFDLIIRTDALAFITGLHNLCTQVHLQEGGQRSSRRPFAGRLAPCRGACMQDNLVGQVLWVAKCVTLAPWKASLAVVDGWK